MSLALDHVADLADFITAAPTSFHAASEGARRLAAAGFVEQDETQAWDSSPGGHYLVRDGALFGWRIPDDADLATGRPGRRRVDGGQVTGPGQGGAGDPEGGHHGLAVIVAQRHQPRVGLGDEDRLEIGKRLGTNRGPDQVVA